MKFSISLFVISILSACTLLDSKPEVKRCEQQIRSKLENPESYFDFMVEDIDVLHSRLDKMGYSVTDIERGKIHDTFSVREPGGNRIRVNSSHVDDHAAV